MSAGLNLAREESDATGNDCWVDADGEQSNGNNTCTNRNPALNARRSDEIELLRAFTSVTSASPACAPADAVVARTTCCRERSLPTAIASDARTVSTAVQPNSFECRPSPNDIDAARALT
jgi:hypothetical protein